MKNLNTGNTITLHGNNYRILLDNDTIEKKVFSLAKKIQEYFANKEPPTLLILTNGGLYLGTILSQVLDEIGFLHYIDTICVSRYTGNGSVGRIKITSRPKRSVRGKDVIVVEDLIDEGITLNYLHKLLTKRNGVKSVSYFVLVVKEEHKPLSFEVNYSVLEQTGLGWLVGFGMDDNGLLRGLPFVAEKI